MKNNRFINQLFGTLFILLFFFYVCGLSSYARTFQYKGKTYDTEKATSKFYKYYMDEDDIDYYMFKLSDNAYLEYVCGEGLGDSSAGRYFDSLVSQSADIYLYLDYKSKSDLYLSLCTSDKSRVKEIIFGDNFDSSKVTDINYLFGDCSSLTSLDLRKLNSSNVTRMDSMFHKCENLKSIVLGGKFNTSKATVMESMFYGCSSLTSLDLSKLDTSNVTNMCAMFSGCSSLTSLDLSKLDTSNVTDMCAMFGSCSSLTSLDLSKLNTSKVADMSSMFYGCKNLTELNLSNIDTSSVIDMTQMFMYCTSLESLDLSRLNVTNVKKMDRLFLEDTCLKTLNLSDMTFNCQPDVLSCESLETLILRNFNTNVQICIPYNMYDNENNVTYYALEGYFDCVLEKEYRPSCLVNFTGVYYVEKNEEVENVDTAIDRVDRAVFKQPGDKKNVMFEAYCIYDSKNTMTIECEVDDISKVDYFTLHIGANETRISETGKFNRVPIPKNKDVKYSVSVTDINGTTKNQQLMLRTKPDKTVGITEIKLDAKFPYDTSSSTPLIGAQKMSFELPVTLPVSIEQIGDRHLVLVNFADNGIDEFKKAGKDAEKFLEDVFTNIKNSDHALNEYQNYFKKTKGAVPFSSDISFTIGGYGELIENNGVQSASIKLLIAVKVGTEFEYNTMVWVVPITVQLGVEGGIGIDSQVIYDFTNKKFNSNMKLELSFEIDLYAGVGVGQLASVGVYGATGLKSTVVAIAPMPKDRGIEEIKLTGEAGIRAYLAKMKWEKPLLSGETIIYSRTSSIADKAVSQFDVQDELDSFIASPSSYASIVPSSKSAINKVSTSKDAVVIGAYPDAMPQIVEASGVTMLVYTDETDGRTDLNKTQIKYRLYDSSGFKAPKAVDFDGKTAECRPVVYTDGTDIYVAYLVAEKEFGLNVDSSVYASAFQIKVAKYNKKADKFETLGILGNKGIYSFSPTLLVDKGVLYVAWVENNDNHPFGATKNNFIYMSKYDKGFSTPETIIRNVPGVSCLKMGLIGEKATLAYVYDADGNMSTEDKKFAYREIGSTSPFSYEPYSFSCLQYTKVNGRNSLAYNRDGAVFYTDTVGVAPHSISGVKIPSGTDFVIDTERNSIYYLKKSGDKRDIYRTKYVNGKWTIGPITSNESGDYVNAFSLKDNSLAYLSTRVNRISDDETSEIRYLGDVNKQSAGLAFVGNTFKWCTSLFKSENISKASNYMTRMDRGYSDEDELLDLYVKNDGNTMLDNVHIKIGSMPGGSDICDVTRSVNIAPMEAQKVEVSADFSSLVPGKVYITIVPDGLSEGDSAESYELDLGKPDFVSETTFISKDQKKFAKIVVRNEGTKGAQAKIELLSDKGTVLFSKDDVVRANEYKEYEVELNYSDIYESAADNECLIFTNVISDIDEFYTENNNSFAEVWKTDDEKHVCNYEKESVIKTPTCTSEGSKKYECECGEYRYETIPALGHSLNFHAAVDATLKKDGVRSYYDCTKCKNLYADKEGKALLAKKDLVLTVKSVSKTVGKNVYSVIESPLGKILKVTYKKSKDSKLKTISIGKLKINNKTYKVDEIASDAFKGHKSLTSVTVESSVTTIGKNAFSGCVKLKTVKGASGVTTIADSAFSGCTSLSNVPAFAKVNKIGEKSFYNCSSMSKFTIGSNVASIGKSAFQNCKKLKAVKIVSTKLTDKNVGANSFKSISSTATITVPKNKYSAYVKLLKKRGITGKLQKIKK
ncbi:MAG: BspA family leucine-rich repeat surface protein [Lachnospiraceae bacterium]|nr:BspA family leucine-rich repeat surface protein [Lachnospiraceae bacterium]